MLVTPLPFAAEPHLPLTYRLALGHVLPLPQPGPWGRARRLSVQVGAPWGIDRIDTNGGAIDGSFDDGDLTGKGVRVYIVDTGVLGSHDDFSGRVVNKHGHTVRAAPVAARIRPHRPSPAIVPRAPGGGRG